MDNRRLRGTASVESYRVDRLQRSMSRPSRKRCRYPMTSVPGLSPVSGALSPFRADLIPSHKRVRDFGYFTDVEVDPRKTSLKDDVMVKGIDARVVVEAVDQEESETGTSGPIKVRVERVTLPMMLEDTPEPAQKDRVVECTYVTLESLVQRFHDHTEAILVHRIQTIGSLEGAGT
nr:hypothetical protein [Tanacetum cinerariifolium]